jgi:hypothetical protein
MAELLVGDTFQFTAVFSLMSDKRHCGQKCAYHKDVFGHDITRCRLFGVDLGRVKVDEMLACDECVNLAKRINQLSW